MAEVLRSKDAGFSRVRDITPESVSDTLRGALETPHVKALVTPLASVSFKRDHCLRVGAIAGSVHTELGSSSRVIEANKRAGIGHDAFQIVSEAPSGLTVVYDKIKVVNKVDLLTDEEWCLNTMHPIEGARYYNRNRDGAGARLIYFHHATQGSRSYPREANEAQRDDVLFAAIDTADALFNPRSYAKWEDVEGVRTLFSTKKEAWSVDRVRVELSRRFGHALPDEMIDLVVVTSAHHAGVSFKEIDLAA